MSLFSPPDNSHLIHNSCTQPSSIIFSPSITLILFFGIAISTIRTRVLFGTVKTFPDWMRPSTRLASDESAFIKSVKACSSTAIHYGVSDPLRIIAHPSPESDQRFH